MSGLTPETYKELRETLLRCENFHSPETVTGIFTDPRLKPWKQRIGAAQTPSGRVDAIIDCLLDQRQAGNGKLALVLLLEVLGDRADPGTACHHDYRALACKIECESASVRFLPTLHCLLYCWTVPWGRILLVAGAMAVLFIVAKAVGFPPIIGAGAVTRPTATAVPADVVDATATPTPPPAPTPPDICSIFDVAFLIGGSQKIDTLSAGPNETVNLTARVATEPGCIVSIRWTATNAHIEPDVSEPTSTQTLGQTDYSYLQATFTAPGTKGKYTITAGVAARSERTGTSKRETKFLHVDVD